MRVILTRWSGTYRARYDVTGYEIERLTSAVRTWEAMGYTVEVEFVA